MKTFKSGKRIGRPPVPKHLKAKPVSKSVRIPLEIADVIKQLSDLYRNGTITIDDMLALANQSKGA